MYNSNTHKIQRALLSVSNKSGLVEFAKVLDSLGIEIYSTGGTKKSLIDNGIKAKSVSEITNFPEILGGRVKTLHPAVHSGLLADLNNEEHVQELARQGFFSIDLVCVNLYPFEETLKSGDHDLIIENIDIGGPAMVRASAKNYKSTVIVVNPENYDLIAEQLQSSQCIDLETRSKLAVEAFAHTARYDSIISNYLSNYNKTPLTEKTIPLKLASGLRYGENPHQFAELYGDFYTIFEKLHGKELSYNNILDIDSASRLISEFDDKPACAIIKHTNPCGVAIGNNLVDAYNKAFSTDTVSPFGGIIAFNAKVDKNTADIIHSIFTELIIAPDFDDDAIVVLSQKKDRRLVRFDKNRLLLSLGSELKSVAGGYLRQNSDLELFNEGNYNVVTTAQPTESQVEDLIFAWKVCKHVKSNAIVYAKNGKTLGIGAGQMSRVDSSRIAVEKAKLMGLDMKNCVIASDAFFPFADGLIEAAEAGAVAVIQPGGSVRDAEVINVANERKMAMILTGMRHFKH